MEAEALIDDIYEAAVIPERWIRVLDGLAELSDGEGTLLFADSPGRVQWICSPTIRSFIEYWVSSKWLEHNVRGHRLIPIREPRFLTDLDGFTREELEREPYYTEFLRSYGLGWCVGTAIRSPSGDTLVFSVEKLHRKGPVPWQVTQRLDRLRPHLARAALLSARVGLEKARATVDALQTIGLPAAVLASDGHALAANAGFGNCAPAIALGAGAAITFSSPSAATMFSEALLAMRQKSNENTGRSIAVCAVSGQTSMVAHVLPLRRDARDIFSGAASLLFMTPVAAQKGPQPALLEALFDLSPAEAKVAGLVVEGKTVESIAASHGVTEHTIRMQLKSVYAKTGVHRQAELVSLLTFPSYPNLKDP